MAPETRLNLCRKMLRIARIVPRMGRVVAGSMSEMGIFRQSPTGSRQEKPLSFSTHLAGEDCPASLAVLTAARRHGLSFALLSGPRVCSQHPAHRCAQAKV